MGSKLLPMTLPELCVHALVLEEGLGARYGEYARLTRDIGAHDVADAFKEMERLEEQESKALKAGVQGRKLPDQRARIVTRPHVPRPIVKAEELRFAFAK